MEISIFDSINSDLAINQEDGMSFYNIICNIDPRELTISFIGVNFISTSFLNESIGRYSQKHASFIDRLNFIYPQNKEIFKYKVLDVIENALLGDKYDALIENSINAL